MMRKVAESTIGARYATESTNDVSLAYPVLNLIRKASEHKITRIVAKDIIYAFEVLDV